MCLFIVFLSRMECQASRISLCRHVDDLSTTCQALIFRKLNQCGLELELINWLIKGILPFISLVVQFLMMPF